ncbi:MAG: M23 family metallopeptidase [Tepidanaerobacteraceae bacterium]|nr:M23 family metallopeptidase [Tepidanaerobacteraceae bacterium]
MYYNYYEQSPKRSWAGRLDLKKMLISVLILIMIILLKKIDTPLTKSVLLKIDYYVLDYKYDFGDLYETLKKISSIEDSIPVFKQTTSTSMILPVSGEITSRFGNRLHPILNVERMHNGIDIDQTEGSPVKAALDGVVLYVGEDPELGRIIKISHDGDLTTVYGHLRDIYVSQNQPVKQGYIIGTVGKTGLATSPHLHFEILKYGMPQDPEKWLKIP